MYEFLSKRKLIFCSVYFVYTLSHPFLRAFDKDVLNILPCLSGIVLYKKRIVKAVHVIHVIIMLCYDCILILVTNGKCFQELHSLC